MKFKIYMYCILVSFLALPVLAGVNDDPCLIGWWNFNDGAAKDWSAFGHNGKLHNGAKIVYDAERGMVLHNPKAGYLEPNEGHSGHVDCGGGRAAADANLTWADIQGSYSITCWVKAQPDPLPWSNYFEKQDQAIFTKGNKGYGQMIITTVGTAGRVYFRVRGLADPNYDHIYGNTFVDNGEWHHIAAIYDYNITTNDAMMRLFIDGAEEYYSPMYNKGKPTLNNNRVLIAGSDTQPTKDGEIYMDDVRLYKRAITPEEILDIMDEPTPSDFTGDSKIDMDDFAVLAKDWMETDSTIASDTGGMVAHWDFEGAAGSTSVPDLVGDNDGTIIGSGYLDGSGSAVLSGGRNGPYIDLGSNLGQTISKLQHFTVIMDFVWDGNSAGSWQRLFTLAQPGTTEFACFTFVSVNETYFRYYLRHSAHDEQSDISGTNMKGHYQIAMTYTTDYADYGCSIFYFNGVKKKFQTNSTYAALGLLGQTSRNYIGRGPFEVNSIDPNTFNIDNRFAGKFNDVRIYNRRLSERDVKDVFEGISREHYMKLEAPGNLSDSEPANDKVVDFKDLAMLVNKWLQDVPLVAH
jgi:hypothetical protein